MSFVPEQIEEEVWIVRRRLYYLSPPAEANAAVDLEQMQAVQWHKRQVRQNYFRWQSGFYFPISELCVVVWPHRRNGVAMEEDRRRGVVLPIATLSKTFNARNNSLFYYRSPTVAPVKNVASRNDVFFVFARSTPGPWISLAVAPHGELSA